MTRDYETITTSYRITEHSVIETVRKPYVIISMTAHPLSMPVR